MPTSPLALWSAATTVPGSASATSHAADSTRPDESTATSSSSCGESEPGRHRPTGDEHRGVLDGAGDRPQYRAGDPHTGARRPPAVSATGPLGRKLTSGGRTPSPDATASRAPSSRRRAWRPSA